MRSRARNFALIFSVNADVDARVAAWISVNYNTMLIFIDEREASFRRELSAM